MIESVKIEKVASSLKRLKVDASASYIALAVSGGGDSMALVLLMHSFVKENGGKLIAFTVEHGLREDSLAEAEGVHKILSGLGIEHRILKWEGEKPKTRIEELAREARYNLLIEECKKEGVDYLAVAHNIEDLVETFWIRLSHGSGLDGLSSIAPVFERQSVKIIRPLLDFTREELRAVCKSANVEWFEDSSNKDEKYLRVKLRKFEQMLKDEGLTSDRLLKVITKLEDSREGLDFAVTEYSKEVLEYFDLGYIRLDVEKFKKYPKDIQRRILAKALDDVYPQKYKTGFDLVDSATSSIVDNDFKGVTLSGCEIFPEKEGGVFIAREYSRVEASLEVKNGVIWDNRVELECINLEHQCRVAALGDEGLRQLKADIKLKNCLEKLPYKIKLSIPAIWQEDRLLSVPNLGYNCQENLADIKVRFLKNK